MPLVDGGDAAPRRAIWSRNEPVSILGAWRNAARYVEGRGSVKTWLLSIVHHRAIDALRNLVANAITYAPEQSTIRIDAAPADQLERAVADLQDDLAKAEASGSASKVRKAREALEARQVWLDQARAGVAEFGG